MVERDAQRQKKNKSLYMKTQQQRTLHHEPTLHNQASTRLYQFQHYHQHHHSQLVHIQHLLDLLYSHSVQLGMDIDCVCFKEQQVWRTKSVKNRGVIFMKKVIKLYISVSFMINQYLVDGIIIKKRKEAVSEIRKILTVNLSSCLDTNVLWHTDPHIDLNTCI